MGKGCEHLWPRGEFFLNRASLACLCFWRTDEKTNTLSFLQSKKSQFECFSKKFKCFTLTVSGLLVHIHTHTLQICDPDVTVTWLPNKELCIAHQQVHPVFLAAGFSDRRVILSRCCLLPAPPRIWQRKLIHFLPVGWIQTALSTAIQFALDQECILRSTSRAFSSSTWLTQLFIHFNKTQV